MIAIEADNKSLKGVLPKNYANLELDKRVLGNVVDVFTNMARATRKPVKIFLAAPTNTASPSLHPTKE